MGQIQSAINQAAGALAIAGALSGEAEAAKMTAKYGPGGKVEEKIFSQAGIKPEEITLEKRQALEPKLSRMREEAETTDLREKQAKIGPFPTEESKRISKEGHDRKGRNIKEVSDSFRAMKNATDSMNDAIDSKVSQKEAFQSVIEGKPNPMKRSKLLPGKKQRRY